MAFIMYSFVALICIVLVVGWQRALNTNNTADQLRTELLRVCLGDKQLAGRLVMREVRRQPGISIERAMKQAILSYKRDA